MFFGAYCNFVIKQFFRLKLKNHLKNSFSNLRLPCVLNLSKRSHFIVHVLVMATEWPSKSATSVVINLCKQFVLFKEPSQDGKHSLRRPSKQPFVTVPDQATMTATAYQLK